MVKQWLLTMVNQWLHRRRMWNGKCQGEVPNRNVEYWAMPWPYAVTTDVGVPCRIVPSWTRHTTQLRIARYQTKAV